MQITQITDVITGTQANATAIDDSAEALWTLSCASNPPAARIHPSAAVPIPEPTFIQKDEAAFPMPAVQQQWI